MGGADAPLAVEESVAGLANVIEASRGPLLAMVSSTTKRLSCHGGWEALWGPRHL